MKKNISLWVSVLLILLVFLSACDSAQGKTEPVGTTTNLGATSETTTDRQSEDDKMKKYPVFEHLGFEEEQKINHWLNQGSNSDFVYYDASHDLYYFTDTIPRDVMYLTRIPTGGIYTMDGKTWEVKKISDDVAKSIRVYDGWVYYINASEFCMLYRMKADGSMRERVTDRTVGIYEFVGNQIYFIDFIFPKYFIATGKLSHFSTKHKQLSRMNPDGSGYEIVQEEQYWRLRYIDPYLYAEANDWSKSLSDIWRFDPSDPFRPVHMEPAEPYRMRFFMEDGLSLWEEYPDDEDKRKGAKGMKFYLRRSDGESSDIAVLEIALSKIGLIGGEMYGIGYEGEENQTVQIYKIDAFDHLSPIEHTEFSRRDTYVAYAGELMMIHHAKGVTVIRPKDSLEKTVLGVKAPPDQGNVEAVMREIEECKEILAYFEERGMYDGETLNFESIPELGYRAPLKNFLVFLHLPNPYLSNLFEMSADELVEAQVSIEEIQGLKRRFQYLKELAENASL